MIIIVWILALLERWIPLCIWQTALETSWNKRWWFMLMFKRKLPLSFNKIVSGKLSSRPRKHRLHICIASQSPTGFFVGTSPQTVCHPPQPSTLSLKARHTTAFWWPLYSLLISPVSTHHRRARLSEEAVRGEQESEPDLYTKDKIYLLLT